MVDMRERAQQARELASNGDWESAAEIYKGIIDDDPFNMELRRQFISMAFRQQDYRGVVEQYLECAEIDYDDGDIASAIRRYDETLRLAEVVDGQYGPGAGDKVRAIVAPLLPDIYYQFGDFHLAEGQAELALQYLQKSDQLAPGKWETQMGLGQAFLLRGRDHEAIQAFQEVIRLAPSESAVAHELLGEVFMRQGRPKEQIRNTFYKSADAYYRYGEYRDAIRICNRVLEVEPDNQTVRSKIEMLKIKLQETET